MIALKKVQVKIFCRENIVYTLPLDVREVNERDLISAVTKLVHAVGLTPVQIQITEETTKTFEVH